MPLRFLLPILSFTGAIFSGCQPTTPSAPPPTSPSPTTELVQWSGSRGGPETAGTRIIRTAAEWEAFWREVGQDAPEPWSGSSHMAVAIFLGQKRTGGYSAKIVGSRIEQSQLVVEYRETAPGPGVMVTQMLTAPWVVARLPRSELPVIARPIADATSAPTQR